MKIQLPDYVLAYVGVVFATNFLVIEIEKITPKNWLHGFGRVTFAVYKKQNHVIASFQIAPIFTMPVSGELCTSKLGWPSVYYLHGVICIVLFTVFIFYHRNSPHKHPLMHRKELVKVSE